MPQNFKKNVNNSWCRFMTTLCKNLRWFPNSHLSEAFLLHWFLYINNWIHWMPSARQWQRNTTFHCSPLLRFIAWLEFWPWKPWQRVDNIVKGNPGLNSQPCDQSSEAGCLVSCYLPDLITITLRILLLHSALQSDAISLQPEAHTALRKPGRI